MSIEATFESFNLDPRIQAIIKEEGFEIPTPIQVQAIPVILEGKDIFGLAQTGTGKTAAFVLPIIQKLVQTKSKNVRALIIAPTRELAQQISETFEIFGRPLGLRGITAYGGASTYRQVQALRQGVDIVVGCPGRILDHIDSRNINLSNLEFLVLDEADQMFDMGFIPTIKRIIQKLPKERQSLLFSATMPQDIRHLANDIMTNPVNIQVGKLAPTVSVTQALYPVAGHLKTALLLKLLEKTDTDSVLIFVRTKARARKLHQQLDKENYNVTSLQGNLSPGQRKNAMGGFRDGKYQIMVATDIAARGIDISSISHVINYDMPDTVEAYTHRIGRTGRAAKTGDAFTLMTREDASMVIDIERRLKTTIERRTIEGFEYKQAVSASDFLENHTRASRGRSQGRSQGGGFGGGGGYGGRSGGRSSGGRGGDSRGQGGFSRGGGGRGRGSSGRGASGSSGNQQSSGW